MSSGVGYEYADRRRTGRSPHPLWEAQLAMKLFAKSAGSDDIGTCLAKGWVVSRDGQLGAERRVGEHVAGLDQVRDVSLIVNPSAAPAWAANAPWHFVATPECHLALPDVLP